MTKIAFIGDIMLGRMVGRQYEKHAYSIVETTLRNKITNDVDIVFANLESPVAYKSQTDGDHLQFKGNPNTLNELQWINAFSLSNNHITDCGPEGITETIDILEQMGFNHNGIFSHKYEPFIIDQNNDKIAIVTATDMLNIPFPDNCEWKTLRVGEKEIIDTLKCLHNEGFCVILYVHIGMLFTRYPNPFTREYLHKCIDNGADIVISAHSHCLGGMEMYKDKPIFHSLGDFIMDGNSFRRRQSAALKIEVEGRKVKSWDIIPAMIDMNYQTIIPDAKTCTMMRKSFQKVSKDLENHITDYHIFFKNQYKKEMINHTLSTLHFLLKQRGLGGMIKMVGLRFEEVFRMFSWISRDRSKDRRDDEAIKADRKKFKEEELFSQ